MATDVSQSDVHDTYIIQNVFESCQENSITYTSAPVDINPIGYALATQNR